MRDATFVEKEIDGVKHVVYVGAELKLPGATEPVATTVDLGDQFTYFQDVVDLEGETVALNVAYLHIDSEGRPWILPLLSEKDTETESPAN